MARFWRIGHRSGVFRFITPAADHHHRHSLGQDALPADAPGTGTIREGNSQQRFLRQRQHDNYVCLPWIAPHVSAFTPCGYTDSDVVLLSGRRTSKHKTDKYGKRKFEGDISGRRMLLGHRAKKVLQLLETTPMILWKNMKQN